MSQDINKRVTEVIERMKELNTRQTVASENNKVIVEKIKLLLSEIESYDMDSEPIYIFKEDIKNIIESVTEILIDDLNISYKERYQKLNDVQNELTIILETILTYWENTLEEFQR